MKNNRWLAQDLVDALDSIPGSPERLTISYLVKNAKWYSLSGEFARATSSTVAVRPDSILRCISRCDFDTDPLWFEMPFKDRILPQHGGNHQAHTSSPIETVGGVMVPMPDAERQFVGFVSWRTENGGVYHSYAIIHWDLSQKKLGSIDPGGDAFEALSSLARARVPKDFGDEMEIWQAPHSGALDMDAAIRHSCMVALGEHPMLLTSMLMMNSDAAVFSRHDDDPDDGSKLMVDLKPSRFSFLNILGLRSKGLSVSNDGQRIYWRDPK